MRETHTAQRSIFQTTTNHEIAYELKRMSDWLDGHPELLDQICEDLQSGGGHPANPSMQRSTLKIRPLLSEDQSLEADNPKFNIWLWLATVSDHRSTPQLVTDFLSTCKFGDGILTHDGVYVY